MQTFIFIITGIICALLGFVGRALLGRFKKKSAEREAERILSQGRAEAERITKEARLSAKEESLRRREEFEAQTNEARRELREKERRLSRREDNLDRKVDLLGKRERFLENLERKLSARGKDLERKNHELARLLEVEKEALRRISGLTREQARELLLKRIEKEVEVEAAELLHKATQRAKDVAEQKAKNIISLAIQRCAADHTAENVVSTIDIPNDDMKGRIIGREGRNIRSFEKATGVDVIIDDTPSVVVVSGFDSIRREIARRAMEKLILDGRIHPARIEEVVEATKKEMDQHISEVGNQAALELGIHRLHPREIVLLGRLKYRTSYGQNVLQHSTEVAILSGIMATELGLDVNMAKRCGFLHDIGKAVDHQVEGSHPQIGAGLARRFEESPEVINAIAGHHEDVEPTSIYTILVAAADAISAARPGARRETLEHYIKRLQRLEDIANSFPGVDQAYAIQAGREVRVILNSEKIGDKEAVKTCQAIAKEIEQELSYPGEVKVTVIRETRAVDYAR